MDEDSARAIRFLLLKAALFIALPAALALVAALFFV
ncbi:phosphoribosylformylglycinamidine synthase-associated small membrane protein [Stappia sp.]|nr:phosphoribosylformylglycinamidine synthase-associated small membrane protein [Stappia sp.]|tara:strand:+ start:45 stop:152 length:108 start_codon:yes stop_codon:yes gene_type:complete